MQVADLITLMGTLSVGSDNVPSSERAIFLQYLNLAHFQLYQETALWNDDLLVTETLQKDQDSPSVSLSSYPYAMNSVYDATHGASLKQKSIREILGEDPLLTATGNPTHYYRQKNLLFLYPLQATPIEVSLWYTPSPIPLNEGMEETDIPYPAAFHPVLADGALYYLFQQEGGFKNTQKENEAKERWKTGRTNLLSYLYSDSAQILSTFSNV